MRTPYSPQSQGIAEHAYHTLKIQLQKQEGESFPIKLTPHNSLHLAVYTTNFLNLTRDGTTATERQFYQVKEKKLERGPLERSL